MLSGLLRPTHLLIVVVVALVFLAPKRLPDAGRALGQGLRGFKKSIGAGHDEHPIRSHVAVTHQENRQSTARAVDHGGPLT
ncbi:MAG: twin-arginine translocase TatA/TatE family subunit [Solirubrobacterales bacterium]|nr:twin-arginine translocase TatA/TatE family subunit [Solirubrobacterales bacterium]